jgi:hypothetical protein
LGIPLTSENITRGADTRQNFKNKALVVTSRNVQFTIVQPVVEELQRRHWKVTVLRFERIWEKAERLLSMTTKRRSLKSFYVKTTPKRPKKINWYVYNLIARFALYLMNLFGLEKPDVIIVLTDGPLPCKITVLVGKLANIPSLLLLHVGMIGRNYECPSFLVDKIAVTGEFAKDILIKCGVDENRLVITGRPAYDALVHAEKQFDKDVIYGKLGLDPTKKIIVYTTENLPPRESRAMTHAICKAVKQFSDLQFVIKVHPSELTLSIYERAIKEIGVNALITRDANIYEVLYICDIVITAFSATALDAMILDKPVITINFTGLEDPLPFAESGAAIGVYEESDLVPAIKIGLYDDHARKKLREARKKFVFEQSYKQDGKATERVVELIEQMNQNALNKAGYWGNRE